MIAIKRTPLWPDPRVKPLFGAAEINWAHPLARGLVRCFLCWEGAGLHTRDLVSGFLATFETAATRPTWASTARGVGIHFTDSGSAGNGLTLSAADYLSVFTMVAHIIPANLTDYRAIFGSGQNGVELRIDQTAGTLSLLKQATALIGTSSRAVVAGVPAVVAVSYDASGNYKFCFDGLAGGSGISLESFSFATLPKIGNAGATNEDFAGDLGLFYEYRVALSANDLAWLTTEPYVFLRPLIRRRYFVPAAAAAPSIPRVLMPPMRAA